MRIAVIGAGRMGAIRVEDLRPLVDDIIIANRTPATAVELAARFGATAVDLDTVLDHAVDAYVLATATDAHAGLLSELISRGRPILCEKPIALTLEENDAIIEQVAATGTPVQIGFQRRFDSGMAAAQQLIATGALGTLYAMHMVAHDHQPSTIEFLEGSGGIFRDLHVHDFDLIRWLTASEIETVYATKAVRAHEQYATYADADTSLIHAVTADGVQVSVSGTRHDPVGHDVHMEIFGSLDSVAPGVNARTPLRGLDEGAGTETVMNIDPYRGFVDRFRDAFRGETAAFTELVAGTRDNPCPPDSAREALRVALACEVSVEQQRPVRVAEIVAR
jgi:myo-inositol 2-dehydrogenase/D-chiro-inositol 1-dehydrogenase